MTDAAPLSRNDLIGAMSKGAKPKAHWRIGAEHEKFGFDRSTLRRPTYEGDTGILAMLTGLQRFGWSPVEEAGYVIALERKNDEGMTASISLEPGGQFELSGAPLKDVHDICNETGQHLMEVKQVADQMNLGFLGTGFDPMWRREDVPVMPKGRYVIMRNYMPKKGKLGLDMMAELDGRFTRVVGLDLAAEAGLDLNFNPATGNLGVGVAFDPSLIETVVSFNDLKPEASAQVATGFATIAETIVPPLLEGALGDISFPLPSISGLGLVSADIAAVGPIQDFLGVFGTIGPVPYGDAASGCDALGLSDTSGCTDGSSCATATRARGLPFFALLLAAGLRRRKTERR